MTRLGKTLFAALVLSTVLGCSTTQHIDEINYSLADVQRAVGSTFPKGVKNVSSNQREYTSNFFDPSSIVRDYGNKRNKKSMYRATSQVSILGDRRPYRLEIDVEVEERADSPDIPRYKRFDMNVGKFESLGTDAELAKKMAEAIRLFLHEKVENKNVIEDFRPF